MRLNGLDWLGFILTIIGGLNWGLIGLFNFNLVTFIFGIDTLWTKIVYILVGLGALLVIYTAATVSSRDYVETR